MAIDLCLDAGALVAIERGSERVRSLLDKTLGRGGTVFVPAGVIAQVWRGGGPRQARLAQFLARRWHREIAFDAHAARAVGELCGRVGATDVVDAHVALVARMHSARVLTTDAADLRRFPGVRIIEI